MEIIKTEFIYQMHDGKQNLEWSIGQKKFFFFFQMSEDCLTLNVYTPLGANNKRLQTEHSHRYSVLVWIHGGYYQAYTAGSPFYNGLTLASAAQIIVVTLNYRLGIVYVLVKPFKSDNHFQISSLHVHVYRILKKYFKGGV